ncbi:hypothetical protein [Peterkaempfera sp. SMS 1(5)a]|uniref:hypothetical protein n=1 Tax=Peterkaempfera podocarpi TaxID=3232308 RepID=UPI003671656B
MRVFLRAPGARRLLTAAAVLLLLTAAALTTGHPAAGQQPPHSDDALPTAPQAPHRSGAAVLAPIVAGLLLTGYAAYRRRGLPGGHHTAAPGGPAAAPSGRPRTRGDG